MVSPSSVIKMSVKIHYLPKNPTTTCPMSDCGGRLVKLSNRRLVWYVAGLLNRLTKRLISSVSAARSNLWQCLIRPCVLPCTIFREQLRVLSPRVHTQLMASCLQRPLPAKLLVVQRPTKIVAQWSEDRYSARIWTSCVCRLLRRHGSIVIRG